MAEARQGQRWRVVVPIAALVLLGAGYATWRAGDAAKTDRSAAPVTKIPVTVATAQTADFPLYLYGLGTVTPPNSVTVTSQVTGVVTNVAVKQGQLVNKGDLLAEIDPRSYQAMLDLAKAKLAQDQANLANAQGILARLTTLLQKTYESQQNVDNQQAVVNATAAQIEGDKATIAAAQLNLDFTKIKAPLTGKTSFRTVDPGNVVQANQNPGLFSIVQLQPIYVTFTEPQGEVSAINKIHAAGPVAVDAFGADGKTLLGSGTLEAVDNRVDQASGTISLKATFENEDNALWPGLSVKTRMRTGMLSQAVTVPDEAVQHGPDGLFAYVAGDDGKAHRQTVKAGPSDGGNTVISEGLTAGQRVVIAGQYRVVDGVSVDAKPASSSTEPARQAANAGVNQ